MKASEKPKPKRSEARSSPRPKTKARQASRKRSPEKTSPKRRKESPKRRTPEKMLGTEMSQCQKMVSTKSFLQGVLESLVYPVDPTLAQPCFPQVAVMVGLR